MYSYNPYYEKWLTHHGIKNQKWGVKHGPPYPLDRKVSNRIKNPHKYKYRVGSSWAGKPEGPHIYDDWGGNKGKGSSALAGFFDRKARQVQFSRKEDWSGGEPVHRSISSVINKYGEEKVSKVFKNLRKDPEELLKMNVNPNYGENGTTQNCAKATAALALNAMGFNVQAGRSQAGRMTGEVGKWFTGAEVNHLSYDDGASFLDKQNNGSFGEICIKRSSGSGHSMFWKKESDGNVYIKDGQINEVYRKDSSKSLLSFIKDYQRADVDSVDITNLTNTKPNWLNMDGDSVISMRTIGSNFANKNLNIGDSNKWIDLAKYNPYYYNDGRYGGSGRNPDYGRVYNTY